MSFKRILISSAAALGLAAASFGLMGASAPAAEAGLFCQAKISTSGLQDSAYTVCKGTSSNNYRQARVIAYCGGGQTVYGPWKWNGQRSSADCPSEYPSINRAAVQMK